ncbi:MAG: hypothetical protein RL226_2392 [Bacteroidota bacterium]|jgi:ribosomal protein L17
MKELKQQYMRLKHQAIELMQMGNINAYLAKLKEVDDVRMQLIQIATTH